MKHQTLELTREHLIPLAQQGLSLHDDPNCIAILQSVLDDTALQGRAVRRPRKAHVAPYFARRSPTISLMYNPGMLTKHVILLGHDPLVTSVRTALRQHDWQKPYSHMYEPCLVSVRSATSYNF